MDGHTRPEKPVHTSSSLFSMKIFGAEKRGQMKYCLHGFITISVGELGSPSSKVASVQ